MKKLAFGVNLLLLSCYVSCSPHTYLGKISGVQAIQLASPVYNLNAGSVSKPGLRSEVNIKAVRNFQLKYADATDVSWINTNEGPIACFTKNGLKMKQAFSRNGKFTYSILYYEESKLPGDIRHLVKREYYDLNIFLVIEIQTRNKIIYIVKMEDDRHLKTVKIFDGEMEIIEDYRKG